MTSRIELSSVHLFYTMTSMLQQIFVSYLAPDNDRVVEIVQAINAGVNAAFLIDHAHDTSFSDDERHHAIKASDAYLIILSEHVVGHDEIKAEWSYILQMRRPLYVAKLDHVAASEIDERLHLIPWIDLSKDDNRAIETLIALLSANYADSDEQLLIHMRPITGYIDRKLLTIPIRGRSYGLNVLQKRLKAAPTMILGVGGIGKSRIAAEVVVTSPDIQSAVWFSGIETAQPAHLLQALTEHFELSADATEKQIFRAVHGQKCLIVIDDAERISEEHRAEFVRILSRLYDMGAQILITSREEWHDLDIYETYRPQRPGKKNSTQIIQDMAMVFRIRRNLDKKASRLAKAARYHPGLMEWAVKQCRHLPPERVISQLSRLQGKDLSNLLDEMVHSTIRRMVRKEGKAARETLERLVVCRDGFSYEAYSAMLELDEDTRDQHLDILSTWQFLRVTTIRGHTRYWVDPIVIDCIESHPEAATRHYSYYRELAERKHANRDYTALVPEMANLEIASIYDPNFARWLRDIWDHIVEARANSKGQ